MSFANLASQLDAVDERVRVLENLLGVKRTPVVEPQEWGVDVEEVKVQPMAEPQPVRMPATPMPVVRPAITVQRVPVSSAALEQTIGLKWAGWVGAVVLVIGAAFGIRFGYEQGWFSFVTPAVRLGLLTVAGLGLIATGEWVYRKVNVLSAVGLFGAGIALLFVISFAGHAYYGLYEHNTAFVFMVISMLIGVAVARRGKMVSIAVLAIIGGNLAPLLLGSSHSQFVGFFIYLLVLQRTSLLLAAWGATPRWWTLRGLSLATTSFWVLTVIDSAPIPLTLVFVMLFAALFHYELNRSTHRSLIHWASAGVTFSMLVMAVLTLAIFHLERRETETIRLLSVLGVSVFAGALSVLNYRLRKNSPSAESLSVGYAIQSLALLAVAVPIALSGVWIGFGWSVLAIACAVTGRMLNLPTARYAAICGWALAAMHLTWWVNLGNADAHRLLLAFKLNGCAFPVYLGMSCSLAITGQIIARLIRSETEPEYGKALSIISSAVWVAASLAALPESVATASILVYGNLMLLADKLFTDETALVQSTVIIALATLKWAAVDTLIHRLNNAPLATSAFFSPTQLVGLAVLASLILLYFVAGARDELLTFGKNPKRKIAALIVGAILWFGSFAIDQVFINDRWSSSPIFSNQDHAEQVALSVFWSVFALCSVTSGLFRRVAPLRYFGLALFAITLLKVVTIDLSQISTGYRILSFMALGLLLLGTSVLYGKVSPKLMDEAVGGRGVA